MGLTFIASATASSSATLEFTSGIDSTYNEYQFQFVNMHPQTNNVQFSFQADVNGSTSYDLNMTTTGFRALHNEAGSSADLSYTDAAGYDQANADQVYQILNNSGGNLDDESSSGILTLYDPSSTTYVKHYTSRFNTYHQANQTVDTFSAGYFNTTTAIDKIQFKMTSGNIDAGTIYMYGVG
jgi:hypothetical protein